VSGSLQLDASTGTDLRSLADLVADLHRRVGILVAPPDLANQRVARLDVLLAIAGFTS
jgi:hypothetical protein